MHHFDACSLSKHPEKGVFQDRLFRDDRDRELLIKTLEETCLSAGWVVHSFVFMKNHYHLLIETQRKTLVKGMQYLNSTYTCEVVSC